MEITIPTEVLKISDNEGNVVFEKDLLEAHYLFNDTSLEAKNDLEKSGQQFSLQAVAKIASQKLKDTHGIEVTPSQYRMIWTKVQELVSSQKKS